MRIDKDNKNIFLILDKYISMKKVQILENPAKSSRLLLCWVNFTNTNFDHFEVYSYDIMGIFL